MNLKRGPTLLPVKLNKKRLINLPVQIIIILYITLISECTSTIPSGQAYIDLTKQPFFVDKTEFIKTFFDETNTKHIFISAPPGFGKTTNLQMLKLFSEIELDSSHKPKIYTSTTANQIFPSLAISKHTAIVEKHLAQHVVLYIDLESDTTMDKKIDSKKTVAFFNKKLYQSFESYKWLLDIPKEELSNTYKITTDQIDLLENLNQKKLSNESVSTLVLFDFANILHLYFRKDVMILIDNYDSVLNNFLKPTLNDIETFYQYMSTILRDTFDSNQAITSKGLVMGTSSLVLPHILNTLSDSRHYKFLSDHSFTPYLGFTELEATNLLVKYDCSVERREQVKKFYNGYTTKTKAITIYNPSSITQYLSNINNPDALRPYRNITSKDNNFLWSYQDYLIFGHLLRNLVLNITAKFDHYESYSLQNFTVLFNTSELFKYKVAEMNTMFGYFFDLGYLTHGDNDILKPYTPMPNKFNLDKFSTPNLEIWYNVAEMSAQIPGYAAPPSKGKQGAAKQNNPKGGKAQTKAAKINSTKARTKKMVAKTNSTTAQTQTTVPTTNLIIAQTEKTVAKSNSTTAQTQTTVAMINPTIARTEKTAAKTESTLAQTETNVLKNETLVP